MGPTRTTAEFAAKVDTVIRRRRERDPTLLPSRWLREAIALYLQAGIVHPDPGSGPVRKIHKTALPVALMTSLRMAAELRGVTVMHFVREAAALQVEQDLGR